MNWAIFGMVLVVGIILGQVGLMIGKFIANWQENMKDV
jgi:uncharacterized membrane-anchored protein YhcB (DUF1043 family)